MEWPHPLTETAALIYLLLATPLLYLSTKFPAYHATFAFILALTASLNINSLHYRFLDATSSLPAPLSANTRAATANLAALLFYTTPTWILTMLLLRTLTLQILPSFSAALPTSVEHHTDRAIVHELNTPTFFAMCWVLLFVNIALVPVRLFDLLFALDQNPEWAVWFGVYVGCVLATAVVGVGNVVWSVVDFMRYGGEVERAEMEETEGELVRELEKGLWDRGTVKKSGIEIVDSAPAAYVAVPKSLGKGIWVDSMV